MADTQSVTGVVEATNEKGLKINGGWLNYSLRFFKGEKATRGDQVTLAVSGQFINECKVTGKGQAPSTGGNGGGFSGPMSVAREKDIHRQVALKAAVNVAMPKNGIPDDTEIEGIIAVARAFEAYLNEPVETDDEVPY